MNLSTVCSRTFPWLLLLLAVLLAARPAAAAPGDEKAQTVIHLLDYVSVDYPETVRNGVVQDAGEYEEQREFVGQVLALLGQLRAVAGKEILLRDAQALATRIEAKAPGVEVSRLARVLAAAVIQRYELVVKPRQAPDLARAASLFRAQCAVCHGTQGRGDGPAARGMDPAPSNFHDAARMGKRSIYGLYNTITLGVTGTGMRPFTELSEADRWALAFLASGMGTEATQVAQGASLWAKGTGRAEVGDLGRLVSSTSADLHTVGGADLVAVRAHLVAQPAALASAAPPPLALARAKLAEALAAYRTGDRAAARQHAITAYLEGFELVESSLDNVDPALRRKTEEAMMALRSDIDAGRAADAFGQRIAQVNALLEEADRVLSAGEMSAATAFTSSLLILLREGLEAILVLAAIIAFVRKTGRRDALPYVHIGWIAAVVLGGVTWFVASRFVAISGASRELTEGISALLAAVMLLYVGQAQSPNGSPENDDDQLPLDWFAQSSRIESAMSMAMPKLVSSMISCHRTCIPKPFPKAK